MNIATLRRICWFQYRQLLPVWLVVTIVTALIIVIQSILVGHRFANDGAWGVAIFFSCLSGLTCGSTLFSIDREQETHAFLQCLPIPSRSSSICKLLVGLAGSVLVAAAVSTLILLLGSPLRFQAEVPNWLTVIAGVMLPTAEFFLAGAFFSAITKRTLVSATLGVMLVVLAVTSIVNSFTYDHGYLGYVRSWAPRLGFFVVLTAGAMLASSKWLVVPSPKSANPAKRPKPTTVSALTPHVNRTTILLSLIWQSFRQSRLYVCAVIASIPLSFLVIFAANSVGIVINTDHPDTLYSIWTCVFFSIAGGVIFTPDQLRDRFHFFHQHAEYPRWIWFSRQLLWWIVILVIATVSVSAHYTI